MKISLSGDGDELRAGYETAVGLGFRSFKVKVGRDPDADAARVELARELAGEDAFLGADANGGWTLPVALDTVPRLAASRIAFIEQPVRADDLEGLREVRSLGIPVVADESVYSPADVLRIGRLGAADVVSVYVGKSSGLERAVESARLATELGMEVVIGANGEMGIGAAAQLHVACACERLSEIPHGIIGHHFYEEDATLARAARHRRRRRAPAGRAGPRRRAERRGAAELLGVNAGVQVFVYPEELDHVGPDELAAQVLALGCDAVSVSVAYHRGAARVPAAPAGERALPEHALHRAVARPLRRARAGRGRGRSRSSGSARRASVPASASGPGSSVSTTASSPPSTRTRPRSCSTAPLRDTASVPPRPRRSSTSPRSPGTSRPSSRRRRSTSRPASIPPGIRRTRSRSRSSR